MYLNLLNTYYLPIVLMGSLLKIQAKYEYESLNFLVGNTFSSRFCIDFEIDLPLPYNEHLIKGKYRV